LRDGVKRGDGVLGRTAKAFGVGVWALFYCLFSSGHFDTIESPSRRYTQICDAENEGLGNIKPDSKQHFTRHLMLDPIVDVAELRGLSEVCMSI